MPNQKLNLTRRQTLALLGAGVASPLPLFAQTGTAWPAIEAKARGQTVYFNAWAGSEQINAYLQWAGAQVQSRYGVKLEHVKITDTAEVVKRVRAEKAAGKLTEGTVDMIWINGENFRTMRQGDLVWCGYTDALPNNALINWDNPAIANDFGVPVDGCEVPWSKAQFAFAHDSATVPNPPKSIPDLITWIKANPGQFTYPAAPDFNGAVFVRHVFYYAAGGA